MGKQAGAEVRLPAPSSTFQHLPGPTGHLPSTFRTKQKAEVGAGWNFVRAFDVCFAFVARDPGATSLGAKADDRLCCGDFETVAEGGHGPSFVSTFSCRSFAWPRWRFVFSVFRHWPWTVSDSPACARTSGIGHPYWLSFGSWFT